MTPEMQQFSKNLRVPVEVILHAPMDCEALVEFVDRCRRWMRQEAGLILTTIFFVPLITTICMVAFDSDQPFFTVIDTSQSTFFNHGNSTVAGDKQAIREIFITGTEALKRFRSQLQCFSDSGQWVYDPTPRHLPWNYIGDPYACNCDGIHLSSWPLGSPVGFDVADDIAVRGAPGNWSVREELKWVWRTNSSCPWRQMDRDDFCRQVGPNEHLMIVGDSLNHEISWAFMNALVTNQSGYQRLSGDNRSVIAPYEMCGDILGEGKGFKVSFVRNDRLSPIANATVDTWNNFYEFPWIELVGELDITTLLLNRGAHYEEDEIYTSALREIFTILSLNYPHIDVIYRNTQPGHLDCGNFTRPLSQIQHDLPPKYHWGNFQRQNMLAKQIVEDYLYTYMDVYTMLSLRPDGHISPSDCLHYCLPGPLDLVAEYFYNILLLL